MNKNLKIDILKFVLLSVLLTSTHLFASTKTFGDNFNSVSYNNNDGTDNFTANWSEYEPYDIDDRADRGYIYINNNNNLYFYWIYAETISRELDLSGASTVTLTFDHVTNNLVGDSQDVQMRNANGVWITVLSIDENTLDNTTLSYNLTPEFIHSTSAIRFVARGNWGFSDNVSLDNLLFTATYIDSDSDGIEDVEDVDDDNDGILDTDEESSTQIDSFSNANGGTHTANYGFTDRSTVTIDINTLDTAFNVEVAGITLLSNGNIMDTTNTSGRTQLLFTTSGGSSGTSINNPETANSNALPRVRVYIDAFGAVSVYGTRETSSTLLELLQTGDGSSFNTFSILSGVKEITVSNPNDVGSSGLTATNTVSINFDNDGDGIVNSLDLDSDNDGIPDNVEAQSSISYMVSSTPPAIRLDGSNSTYPVSGLTSNDTDSDGIPDHFDNDSDNDLITDCDESYGASFTKICPVDNTTSGNTVGTNGLVEWADTLSDDYSQPSGIISDIFLDLEDEISDNNEVAYREAACGPAETNLTAYQWKTISFPCNTGANGIETLLGVSLGEYGNDKEWVMYQQTGSYDTEGKAETRIMAAYETVEPGKGYWIITDGNKTAKIKRPLSDISQTATVVPNGTTFPGVPTTGVAFDKVMPYDLPDSDSTDPRILMIGNPFFKKLQLSDIYYQNGTSNNYQSTATLTSGTSMEPTVYIKDSSDITTGNYIAITPETPGFGDVIPTMQGFWIKLNADNTPSNKITYPFEK